MAAAIDGPVDETKWVNVGVVVKGCRVIIQIDGKQMVDDTEPDAVKRPPDRAGRVLAAKGGLIALQSHDPKSVWYFKSVRVRTSSSR